MGLNQIKTNDAKTSDSALTPGGVKLVEALKKLLNNKDFNSITTAEISRTAGINEALIYRYFKDKRGLLHKVLLDYLQDFNIELRTAVKTTQGAGNKIRQLIRSHIGIYDSNRLLAKILLLEVRNFPGYFESDTYRAVQNYGKLLHQLIVQGVEEGSLRNDIPTTSIRNFILGAIEHQCMAPIIFEREIDVDSIAEHLVEMVFKGIEKNK